MKNYYLVDEKRKTPITTWQKILQALKRSIKLELFVGLWVVMREMLKRNNSATIKYPLEKLQLDNRYRAVHRLMRFIESENERCIGCGLCEKICISNCIRMETSLDKDGRKKVNNYSINLGRCIYCGFCAEVCPELAIVHGLEYENAAEQRSYFGYKEDFLTPIDQLKQQVEFEGAGSLRKDADLLVKKTPNYYDAMQNKALENQDQSSQGEVK
ncbi:NADH-quinone oxidoreductase subunit NuoI [Campylobacter sp. LH-2024]|uniref:NADH-quinone oxidoreductase subunit NuoI n=1 Tax=Campylobacter molothri TaxID=1032242 RepID=A0ACC5W1A2_9BACT|nr:NADH-quinone oxidoreductase subunit NuoI [Campylobacter sp. 2018MI35]MBZ7928463.1 NADH-quinone oxidoreductase subunit NuoI [Campylobacter sp. RM10542]MBZ7929955.1 NADH-quinone oxidoreductase subunit NuoI [Campylobacter sp. W0067]MBZ7932991.1 NADH-quinone oxidoreductase subunit NuoI [Campylobacter sp. RM10543]MBZ7934502.1 NADH-quinone oxidoreductase subunit NuoI [Campylobacter sp. W0065]MBZ7943680.1 NADH-quinone oxidoreductase subunit NuoI [Campylobacter sp. RM13744]MBZ7945434.1 NADH-quinon